MNPFRRHQPKHPGRLHVRFRDRHAEHALPEYQDELCDHNDFDLRPGDTFRGEINMAVPGSFVATGILNSEAEVELNYTKRGEIELVINHVDYLAAVKAMAAKTP